jgi:hypothetical protein
LLERIRTVVPAGITIEELGPGLDSELTAGRLRAAPGYDRRRDGLTARRRRGDAHRIVASLLAVLALVGCAAAILLLAIAPTAARLQGKVASLDARLASTQDQLAALQRMTVHTASQGSRLTKGVRRLTHRVGGLSRTVHGLQGTSTLVAEQSGGLRACLTELQQELSGLTLTTRSVRGRVRSVGLSETAGLSPACGAAFSGG